MTQETIKSEDQEDAEAEVDGFRKDLGPFVVAAETTRMPMIFTDAKAQGNPIIFANDAFLSLTGYDRKEVLAKGFNSLLAAGCDKETVAQIDAAFDGIDSDPEIHYERKDGSEFWASVFVSPVRDDAGTLVQHFVSFVDLTKHKQDQAHCTMLIDELNHRVKNTLSTVQSIVTQALRSPAEADVIRESIETRIFALARSHDLLTEEDWGGAGLHDLVDSVLDPFAVVPGRAERFTVSGGNVHLPPKETLALAIAFHELATNAVKYGAFSNDAGSIRVNWEVGSSEGGDHSILSGRRKTDRR